MAAPPPDPPTTTTTLHTHRALISSLTSFLTVCTHQILYLRRIYPPASFLSTRAYNFPVRQNRHPAVCTWINDAIEAVRLQIAKNTVELLALCIHEVETNQVLERWTFDLHALPTISKQDRDTPFAAARVSTVDSSEDAADETVEHDRQQDDSQLPELVNAADLEATYRATLSHLSSTSARLAPLPSGPNAPGLTFTLTIELRAGADRPVGRLSELERRWIAAQLDVPTPTNGPVQQAQPASKQGATHPIRRVSANPINIELWVEESAHKLNSPFTRKAQRDPGTRAAEMSYGAGTESFDPATGYADIEGTDLNRKPGGGSMTDYQRM
jgi:mitotic spindle assembly checkpoint protein MAD2B